jgi:hypothetical protein
MNTNPGGTGAESLVLLRPIDPHKAHASFQSTTSLLTPTIKLTQARTVRRRPDCTI